MSTSVTVAFDIAKRHSDIPQIVVCGDQSSGKSAVLEAISRLPFPSGTDMTTCFVTELVLRKSADVSVRVAIHSHESGSEGETSKRQPFTMAAQNLNDFQKIHEDAAKHIQKTSGRKGISKDRLRIEVSDPSQPHLTLVDLPGLIKVEADGISRSDIEAIENLMESYLKNPRTLILAVAKATSHILTQSVMDYLKTSDGLAARTLGIITYPDKLNGRSDTNACLDVINNRTVQLGHGWHVVCNLPHDVSHRTYTERDRREADLLSSADWQTLSRDRCGIKALRARLSTMLLAVVQNELPTLVWDMEKRLNTCTERIEQLGPARNTVELRRSYLIDAGYKVSSLLKAAVTGTYTTSDFQSFFETDQRRRIRAEISAGLENFALTMQAAKVGTVVLPESSTSQSQEQHQDLPWVSLNPSFCPSIRSECKKMPLGDMCDIIERRMNIMKGCCLPGLPPDGIHQFIFREQSKQWRDCSNIFVDSCTEVVLQLLKAALLEVVGEHTSGILQDMLVLPEYDRRKKAVKSRVDELLWPYECSHPDTYRKGFVSSCLGQPKIETDTSTRQTWRAHAKKEGWSPSRVEAAKALDWAETYYDASRSRA